MRLESPESPAGLGSRRLPRLPRLSGIFFRLLRARLFHLLRLWLRAVPVRLDELRLREEVLRERDEVVRLRAAAPLRPPFRIGEWFSARPYPPPPLRSPPPCTLFTVAHARRLASFMEVPRFS